MSLIDESRMILQLFATERNLNMNNFLEKILMYDSEIIKKYPKTKKEEIRKHIHQDFLEEKNYTFEHLFVPNVIKQKDRIRMITRGEKIDEKLVLTKEIEQKTVESFKKIGLIVFDYTLGFREPYQYLSFFNEMSYLYESSFVHFTRIGLLLSLNTIMMNTPDEEIEITKEEIRKWYQKTNSYRIKFEPKFDTVQLIKDFGYLVKEEEKEEIKKEYLHYFEQKVKHNQNIGESIELYGKIEVIKNW